MNRTIALVFALAFLPASAPALTSGNGLYEVEFFNLPTGVTALALEDGFRLEGPLSVADGGFRDEIFRFLISAPPEITTASIFNSSTTIGSNSLVVIFWDTLIIDPQSGDLEDVNPRLAIGANELVVIPSFHPWDGPAGANLQIRASAPEMGDSASFSHADFRFTSIPEPSTALLMALGILILRWEGARVRVHRTNEI